MGRQHGVESEAEYLAMMIPHHQEAVDRARELLEITEREKMVELLESIVATQTREIELMRQWLEEWYPDTEVDREYRPMMRSLEGLDPNEADMVFLEDMQMHHMQAVMTSRMLLRWEIAEHEDVEELAGDIIENQLNEIDYMRDLYRRWYEDSIQRHRRPGQMMSLGEPVQPL